ncbi:MAG: hypothetical protein JNK87_24535 [Bryobacterales bacterium]|nr:hypothetical protein [Bryobacterales bacterium]
MEPFEEGFERLRDAQAPAGLAARVLAAAREDSETRFRRRTALLNGLASFGLAACAVAGGHTLLPSAVLAVAGLSLSIAAVCANTE